MKCYSDKLKTLKDMSHVVVSPRIKDSLPSLYRANTCCKSDLRHEAIKWIKELYNDPKYKNNDIYGDLRNSIYWIKNFFNITNKDLEEVDD